MALLQVLLVEDHPLLQQVIQELLAPTCTVIGVLDRAEELSQAVETFQPDVLVLDVSLPGRSGLQILPEIRVGYPELGIVIATNHSEVVYREAALRRGADAFVAKDQLQRTLTAAVFEAHAIRKTPYNGSLDLKSSFATDYS